MKRWTDTIQPLKYFFYHEKKLKLEITLLPPGWDANPSRLHSTLDSVSIDNEYDYENESLPLTIMRMRFAQNTCSTRSGNSFHDEISSKTRSAGNEFLKGKVYLS